MDSVELGKRIKEARLARKMTQSDVVGDFITRNMLSQIESGTATPSVRTLTYLAKVLQLPVNYLLPDELEVPDEGGNSALKEIDELTIMKNAFKRGDYAAAVEHALPQAKSGSIVYDEACSILAMSYLELARSAKETRTGMEFAEQAARYSELGIFAKREVKASAVLLYDKLAESL
ncbi:MAG: helix-turn-helix domain-containing protein [Ruminiclostridium sp.]|nr:helix-turn-helix domain-containing protein [Ruminiclostridium sp.]